MTPGELRDRLALFAQQAHLLCAPLLGALETQDAARQLMRSASSTAANHRAAGRARSHCEFTAKVGLALEECDESFFWLEHMQACQMASAESLRPLLQEARELVAILTTSHKTARTREAKPSRAPGPRHRAGR